MNLQSGLAIVGHNNIKNTSRQVSIHIYDTPLINSKRERERERERQRQRETDRERDRQREREKERELAKILTAFILLSRSISVWITPGCRTFTVTFVPFKRLSSPSVKSTLASLLWLYVWVKNPLNLAGFCC